MRSIRVKPRFFVILSVVLVLAFTGSICAVQGRIEREAALLAQVRQQQQVLVDEIDALEKEKKYVQSDEYIMDQARDDLGMVIPGEIRYMNGGN